MIYRDMPRDGLPVVQAKDFADNPSSGDDLRLRADVVVVGSGSGGATMAYELAKAGRSVIVLEAGRYVPSADFNEQLGEAIHKMYADQGAQPNTTGDTLVLQASCVGGSSVISATAAFRAPDHVLNTWVEDFGLDNLSPEKMAPYFDTVEKNMHVHENESHEINACSRKVIEGAEKLGFNWSPLKRNVKQCALTGFCLAGCPSDRKQSTLVTYLPWATAYGAKVYADTWVNYVRTQDGRATGVEAVVKDPDTGRSIANLRVDADIVVLSAGAIHTPQILQRSQYPDYGDMVGRNLSVHPMIQIMGKFKEPIYGWRGALTGVYVDEFLSKERGAYLFESGLAGPEQVMTANEHGSGPDHVEFMRDYKYMASMNVFIQDDGHGRVRWDGDHTGGTQRIEWQISKSDFYHMQNASKLASRVFFAAGAEKVYLPTFETLIVDDVFQLDDIVDNKIDYGVAGIYTFRSTSLHPQGTCRMGSEIETSVVNPHGETHEIGGLFVADASLFPTGLTVNTEVTVCAVSNYIADYIIENSESYFLS